MSALAYFFTWGTYGTWLPGDQRGWMEYREGWKLPDPILELESSALMAEAACRLTPAQRRAVEEQIAETCQHRGWLLHAAHCRSNHLHVSAGDTPPRKVRVALKAWTTRRLKASFDPGRENWWAERGDLRNVYDEDSLEIVIAYTLDAQDRKTSSTRSIDLGRGPSPPPR